MALPIGVKIAVGGSAATVVVAASLVGIGAMGNGGSSGCGSSSTTSTAPGTTVGYKPGSNGDNPALFTTIITSPGVNNRFIMSTLFGSNIEAGWDNNASGAGGIGVFQIQEPGVVHPDITVAQARDPVYATHYMTPAYIAALGKVPDELWTTDPVQAAEQVAYLAERPLLDYYVNRGADTVNASYAAARSVMVAYHVSTDFTTAGPGVPNLQVAAGTLTALDNTSCQLGGNGSSGNLAVSYAGTTATEQRKTVVAAAESMIGVPYSFGAGNASGPTLGQCTGDGGWNDCHIVGIDCSGLTLFAYAKIGIPLNHNVATDFHMLSSFMVAHQGDSLANVKPGDMLFYRTDMTYQDPGHTGIYLGNGKMIHAPQSGELVQVTDVTTSYWTTEFAGAADPYGWLAAHKA
jgi:cell wall-associated NlpC family hydrolase